MQGFHRLHLVQKIAAVHDVVKLQRSLTAAEVIEKLFQRVAWVLGLDADGAQISGVAKPEIQLRKRVAAFERQTARPVRAADQVLHQQQLVEQNRGEEQTAAVDLPSALEPP